MLGRDGNEIHKNWPSRILMIPQKSFIPFVSEIATKCFKTTKQATPRTTAVN